MGFAFRNPTAWLRYTNAFNTVIACGVNAAPAEAGQNIVVQIDVPPELYAADGLPSPLLRLALLSINGLLVRSIPVPKSGGACEPWAVSSNAISGPENALKPPKWLDTGHNGSISIDFGLPNRSTLCPSNNRRKPVSVAG